MLDWLPIDPIIDTGVRHGATFVPYQIGWALTFTWGLIRFERTKIGQRKLWREIETINKELATLKGAKVMEFIKSPNYTKGRLFRKPVRIVVHSMAGNMQPSINDFLKPAREASSHYLIGHDGREVQMVIEDDTAWHCGAFLHPFNNIDTIGIETEGGKFPDGHVDMFGVAGRMVLAARIAKIHHDRAWGEPSSNTVQPHNEQPGCRTSCPTGLNMAQVIQDAQDAYNGRPAAGGAQVDTIQAPQEPVPQPQPQRSFEPFNTDLQPKQAYREEAHRVQQFLVAKGFMATPASNEWGYYGKKTQVAVDKFQKANGIKAGASFYGWWYPQTRTAANKQLTF